MVAPFGGFNHDGEGGESIPFTFLRGFVPSVQSGSLSNPVRLDRDDAGKKESGNPPLASPAVTQLGSSPEKITSALPHPPAGAGDLALPDTFRLRTNYIFPY